MSFEGPRRRRAEQFGTASEIATKGLVGEVVQVWLTPGTAGRLARLALPQRDTSSALVANLGVFCASLQVTGEQRTLEGDWSCRRIDVTYLEVRQTGRIVSWL